MFAQPVKIKAYFPATERRDTYGTVRRRWVRRRQGRCCLRWHWSVVPRCFRRTHQKHARWLRTEVVLHVRAVWDQSPLSSRPEPGIHRYMTRYFQLLQTSGQYLRSAYHLQKRLQKLVPKPVAQPKTDWWSGRVSSKTKPERQHDPQQMVVPVPVSPPAIFQMDFPSFPVDLR